MVQHRALKLYLALEFAFSARTLAEGVLVPVADDLGIHLGVTSPQPLNNQPYFRMVRLGEDTPVSGAGRPQFDYMVELIAKLSRLSANESRKALRAFVYVRRQFQPRYVDAPGEFHVTPNSLVRAVTVFISGNSEGGKRARRGLNRLRGRLVEDQITSSSPKVESRFLREVRELFAVRHQYLPADFVELQLHDIQFCLCEYDKLARVRTGQGKMKRCYAA